MTNADNPAMPQPMVLDSVGNVYNSNEYGATEGGLSKREHFASIAMQGILANKQYEAPRRNKIEGMAEDAVHAADALLEELSK